MKKVTDPRLLEQLESMRKVDDPELIAQLNAKAEEEQPGFLERAYEGVKDFSEGLGVSGLKTYYGLKDLAGMGSEEDKETLQRWRDMAGESGWGTVGEMGGDLAQLVVPGTAGVKVASKIPMAVRHAQGLRAGTRAAADIAGSAALGYTQLPEGDSSRAGNAAMYGAGAGAGAVLGKTLSIAGQGIKGSKAAQALRDRGVKLTAGQQNEFLRRVEGIMNLIPFTAKGVERSRAASFNSLVRTMQKEADPQGRMFNTGWTEKLTPKQINRELYDTFQEGYAAAWGGIRATDDAMQDVLMVMAKSRPKLTTKGQRKAFERLEDELFEVLEGPNPTMKDVDDVLRAYWKGPGKDPAKVKRYNEALKAARDTLRKALPKENQRFLSELDGKYRKYRVLREASVTAGAERKALVDINDLQAGNRAVNSKFQRSMGDDPYGSLLDDYAVARGNPKEPLLSSARAIIKELPDVAQTRRLQGVLAGTAPWQPRVRSVMQRMQPERAMTEEQRILAERLRSLYSGSRMGGAMMQDEDR